MLASLRFAAVLGALVLLACGGRDASPGVDAGGRVDAAGTNDAGPGTDAGPQPDAATPAGVLRTSYVNAYSYSFGTVESGQVVTQFYDQDPSPVELTVESLDASCELRTSKLLVEPGMGAFPQYKDAGTITVSGGTEEVVLPRLPEGYYDSFNSESALWTGGETLTFSGSGGADVPAFEAMLGTPSHVEITSPPLPLGGPPIDVDRGSDLTISWTGPSTGGAVVVRITDPEDASMARRTVECHYDPGAGNTTIPAAALARLNDGDGTLTIDVRADATVTLAGWGTVELSASSAAVAATGNQYLAAITIR